jgi:hypothetical protein
VITVIPLVLVIRETDQYSNVNSPSYVLHLYAQRSSKTYGQCRSIKLAQATRAQRPASSNMAAQALCEPALKDATKLIDNFKPGFLSAISGQVS